MRRRARRLGALGAFLGLASAPEALAAPPTSPAPATSAAEPREASHRHELYLGSTFAFYSSDRRVLVGLGGGPGYRLLLSSSLAIHVSVSWIGYTGNAFVGDAGAAYSFHFGWWEPSVGLGALLVSGDAIRVLDSSNAVIPSPYAWAGTLRLDPLRLRHDPFAVTVLALSAGAGDDSGSLAKVFAISFLEVGIQL